MQIDLTGKKAIVCGASKGIGRAVAKELANLGASVTVLARNEDTLSQLCKELSVKPHQAHTYLVADFNNSNALKQKVEAFAKQHGPCHILINNSGGPPPGPAASAAPRDFLAAFSQHMIGNHIMVQALLDGMQSENYGRIINVISTSVKQPVPNLGVSNTVRSAVANWAKTLAYELGRYGITVNNILPGYTDTERLKEVLTARAEKDNQTIDEVRNAEIATIPVRRIGRPEEIAQAVAFLASPAASYINGINLPVDGGRTASL